MNEWWHIRTKEYLTTDTGNNMNESQKHNAEKKKCRHKKGHNV